VSRPTVCRAIACRIGSTRKKGRSAAERDELVAAAVALEKLVFVDECGLHTSLTQIYGYAPRGERLRPSVLRTQCRNTTLCLPA
jgi:hypothetical protein